MISLLLESIVEKKNLYIKKNSSLRDLIDLMNKNQKGVVVVLDGKRPVGILTERDLIEILFNEVDLDERADKYTRKTLITTKGDRTIGHALNLMLENNIRRMIVVDDENNFLGIITQKDMLRHLEEDFYRSTIRVKQILEKLRLLVSASPDNTLHEVLKRMFKNKISAVPIVEGGKAVGIITEKDIIKLAGKRVSLEKNVSRYMSRPVITSGLETPLVAVVKVMNDSIIRRVVIEDKAGSAIGIVTIRDVLKSLEGDYSEFLERKLKHAKDVLNLLPEMLIEVSDTGKEHLVIWANEKAINRFGKKILDRPITEFIPAKTWEKVYSILYKSHKIEDVRFKKNDEVYELSGFFIKTDGKLERGRTHLIVMDITEDIKLSTTDPLTGLYNRRFTNEVLMKEIERSKRLNKKFSIVICDLDDFKRLNDNYGHLSGDEVLRSIAKLMTENTRKLDIVGRYGGEEFVIIMPETARGISFHVSDRLRDKIEHKEITLSKRRKVKITASFGIATIPEDGMSPDDLLITADDRLYKAKREGKNKVVSG
ncbi:MAG: GGDEF domain-containing protein [Nitrospirae bacterium]|nr:GGDEF domain-containing protein [Nitrospirota bacterium]